MLKLYIGNKNYSSWSMRPWVLMRQSGISFEELTLRFDSFAPDSSFKLQALALAPTGKVPLLVDEGLIIWDSLAICEYLAEKASSLWPSERKARAEARSVSAEMHAGFMALRQGMPLDVRASQPFMQPSVEVAADIARIVNIWEDCRQRYGRKGPFLFGHFTIADAMYAPVVWRFKTYAVELPPAARDWVEMMCSLPAMQDWRAGAVAEEV